MAEIKSKTRAALFMIAAAASFSLTALAVKSLPGDIPVEQKLLARSVVALLVSGFYIWGDGSKGWMPVNLELIFLRSLFGIVAMFCYFIAVAGLPLSEAVTLNHLSPFFVAVFASIFLGEKMTRLQLGAVFFAFFGAVLVLRPGLVPLSTASVLGLISAMLAGAAYTLLRELRKYDSPQKIVFWFSGFMFLVTAPLTLWRGRLPDVRETLLLAAVGVAGVMGQLCLTAAYRYAPGGEVAIYTYLGVAFSMLWQVVFFEHSLELLPVTGAAVITVGAYINWRAGKSVTKSEQ